MLASYDEIRSPVAWLISELKGLVFDGWGVTGMEREPSKNRTLIKRPGLRGTDEDEE